MVAVLMERGVNMVFWALEQREKRKKELQDKVRAEAVETVLADMRAKAESSDLKLSDWVEQMEREYGLPREKK